MHVYLGVPQRMASVSAEPIWWVFTVVNLLQVTFWPRLIFISMKLKMLLLWTPNVIRWVITMETAYAPTVVNCPFSYIIYSL